MENGHDRRDFLKQTLVLAGTAGLLTFALGRSVAQAQTLGPMRRSNRYEPMVVSQVR